mmetsp:Transcript_12976/g.31542  ORF Transcript_12976/g.31542 Transcript_12976/m.31542 type:complete len:549 (+) Transcript_12976:222-1868(+)
MPYKLGDDVLSKLVIRQQYDSNAILKNLFNMTGTSLPGVFKMPMFWTMWTIHVGLFFIVRFANCPVGSDGVKLNLECRDAKQFLSAEMNLPIGDLGLLNSLTAFFIVFYSGNCFARYTAMYGAAIAIQGKMHNISLYVRSYFVQPATRWNVIRYLLASHYIFYWSLRRRMFDWKNPQYNVDPGTFKDVCKDILIPKGILIPVEADALMAYKGNKHKLLFSWSIIALKRIMQANMPTGEKGNPMLHSEFEQTSLTTDLKKEIVEMRGAIGTIDNSMLFPIPFQYYHMVNMTVFIYLLFLAYGLALKDNPLTILIYPLTLVVVLGLLNTANAMSDPFGMDACDFNQEMITNGIYNECKMLCEEPDESFLSSIGDPSFNPKRNPDGSIDDSAAAKAADAGEMKPTEPLPPKEVMWSSADVQAIIDERDDLKSELKRGGVEDLTEKIKLLVDVNIKGFTAVEKMNQIPREIQEANKAAMLRVDKLEQLVTNQLSKLAGELRGDPFEARYVSAPATAGVDPSVSARIISPSAPGGVGSGMGLGTVFPRPQGNL